MHDTHYEIVFILIARWGRRDFSGWHCINFTRVINLVPNTTVRYMNCKKYWQASDKLVTPILTDLQIMELKQPIERIRGNVTDICILYESERTKMKITLQIRNHINGKPGETYISTWNDNKIWYACPGGWIEV